MTDMFLDHQGLRVRIGVGLLIFNSHKDVLVGESYRKIHAVWHLPHGGSQEGLDDYANAMRVAKRETGLWQRHLWFVGFTPSTTLYELHGTGQLASRRPYNAQMRRWAVFRYLNRDVPPPPELSEDHQCDEHECFHRFRWGATDWLVENCELFQYTPYTTALEEGLTLLKTG